MQNLKAFTLIELLVVISIIIVFTGMAFAAYNNFGQEKKLSSETQYLYDQLELVKKKATSGDDPIAGGSCTGVVEFGGYRFNLAAGSYSFNLCCRNATTKAITSCGANIYTTSFPSNISIVSGASPINFLPLSNGTNLGANQVIRVRNANISKCIDITVTPIGNITVSSNSFPC